MFSFDPLSLYFLCCSVSLCNCILFHRPLNFSLIRICLCCVLLYVCCLCRQRVCVESHCPLDPSPYYNANRQTSDGYMLITPHVPLSRRRLEQPRVVAEHFALVQPLSVLLASSAAPLPTFGFVSGDCRCLLRFVTDNIGTDDDDSTADAVAPLTAPTGAVVTRCFRWCGSRRGFLLRVRARCVRWCAGCCNAVAQ